MKKLFFLSAIIILLAVSSMVIAQGVSRGPATVIPSSKTVIVPGQAVNNSPVLERHVLIHYKKGFTKPSTECGNGVCEPSENAKKCPQDCEGGEEPQLKCYGFLSKGLKIQSTKGLVIHPDLDVSAISASLLEWDSHTSTALFGDYTVDASANWDSESPDGRNELSFGDYSSPGVIAVTVVWGYFSGPPWAREITEFDVLFDTDYTWGDVEADPTVMDTANIATHEIGHGLGLGDIYESGCSEVTMYGYSDYGETKKRTLEQSDITGLQKLYGI